MWLWTLMSFFTQMFGKSEQSEMSDWTEYVDYA